MRSAKTSCKRVRKPGKASSSRNATKHGIRSECPVIPELESQEEWELHREAYVEDCDPEGPIETALAEEAAAIKWRLGRVDRFEREQTSASIRKAAEPSLTKLEQNSTDANARISVDVEARIRKFEAGAYDNDPVVHEMFSELARHSIAPVNIQNLVIRYRSALKRELRQTHADLERRQADRARNETKTRRRLSVVHEPTEASIEQTVETTPIPERETDSFGKNDVTALPAIVSEPHPNVVESLIQAPVAVVEHVRVATVLNSAAELASFGKIDATVTPEATSGSEQSEAPVPYPAPSAPSRGLDKHGYSLEMTRAHRRQLWKEERLKQKQEKRKATAINLGPNRLPVILPSIQAQV